MELNTFISKRECECLNESDDHCMSHCLTPNGGYLQSDCDEQLILSITFNQMVKIHSLKFKGPLKTGPKEMKLFINQPRTIDFDMAESMACVQDMTFDSKDLQSGQPINLLKIYVRNNQSNGEATQIDNVGFIGSPLMTTKMTDFKSVAGEKRRKSLKTHLFGIIK